jgi:competence protein ComFC
MEVVSIFGYKSLEPFLLTKHTPAGHRIFKYFGKYFMAPFLYEFADNLDEQVGIVGIDEVPRGGYAHTSLLTHYVKHHNINVSHAKLIAQNSVNYAGKTLQYRLEHPRHFKYYGREDMDVILVDDIVTTGTTLQEARSVLAGIGLNVIFALCLADAQY